MTSTVKTVVQDVAPEELLLFDDLMTQYRANPGNAIKFQSYSDDPLGFGFEETIVAITPAVAAMATAILSYIINEVVKASQQESAGIVVGKVKALLRRDNRALEDGASLTATQLAHVRKIAHSVAIEHKLTEDEARNLSDSLFVALALAK